MDPRSIEYLLRRRPAETVEPLVRALSAELQSQVPEDQLRALAYMAGRRLAAQHSIGEVRTLAEFEAFANDTLERLDWGWMQVEETPGAVDILHGCAPLERCFGEGVQGWAPAFFEGMYAEWMRQLGAGERLDVRQILGGSLPSEVMRFRLAHESSFAQ
ncbi:hypothetical protein ABSH63_07400 [Sinimarinibacterium sp. HSW-8]|uniref:Cellulose synthase subunit D n=2 Tax=Sinimarinibacterium thermocellulolyticum TaxID=3170016 RepID=A0ABV2A9B0_9GAMM